VLEGALLAVLGVVWQAADDPADSQLTGAVLILLSAVAMGLQSAVGRRLNVPGIATTYITGTLVSLSARLTLGRRGAPAVPVNPGHSVSAAADVSVEPSLGLLVATWVIYIGGAATMAALITFSGPFVALALPTALLMAVILIAVGYFRQ
jgi:uncharacterized membrane protein YoaK (UPF0700 family)